MKDFFLNNQLVRLCKTIHEIPNNSKDIRQKVLVYVNENEPKIQDIQLRLKKHDDVELILMLSNEKFLCVKFS